MKLPDDSVTRLGRSIPSHQMKLKEISVRWGIGEDLHLLQPAGWCHKTALILAEKMFYRVVSAVVIKKLQTTSYVSLLWEKVSEMSWLGINCLFAVQGFERGDCLEVTGDMTDGYSAVQETTTSSI